MAGKISIECPACAAKLNLPDSSKLGKKIKCPKCSEIFVAESNADEDFDDEDEMDDDEKPSSRKRASSGGKDSAKGSRKGAAKGKSSQGNSNLPLIIGGVVGVLGLVGGGIYFSGLLNSKPLPVAPQPVVAAPVQPPAPPPAVAAPPQISAAEKVLGLRWMPQETDLLVHAKLSDIWQAPLLTAPLSSPTVASGLAEFEKFFGMPPSEIQSISIGFENLIPATVKATLATKQSGGMGNVVPSMSPSDVHYVVVIKTKKPMDFKTFAAGIPNAKLGEKNGKTYFEVPENLPVSPAIGAWMPDSTTMIIASSKELFATLERGETIVPRKELKSVDHLPQLVIASAIPNSTESITKPWEDAKMELPFFISAFLQANKDYAFQMASLGLTVKGGFDLQVSMLSGTENGAKKITSEIEKLVGDFRPTFEGMKATAPPLIAEIGEMLMTNLKIEQKNQTVKIATNVPDSAKQKLEQLPPVIMLMAMTGGMGGGLGGLGGPPGPPPGFGSPAGFPGGLQPPSSFGAKMPSEFAKLPGETDPVSASSVEGLPEGMSLTAATAWSAPAVNPGVGGDQPPTENSSMEIVFDVRGDGLEQICAASGASFKSAKLDGGSSAKKTKTVPPGGIDAQKTFIPFELDSDSPLDHPPETLRVRLTVDLPANPGTKIKTLEGSFKYLTFEDSQELTVENVPQTAKSPLKGADFKAGGVKLIRGPRNSVPETLKLECGKDHFLSRVRGTPGDILSLTEVEKGASIQRIYAKQPEGTFPDDFEIKFRLYSHVKEHTVTFRFEDVPLPKVDAKSPSQPVSPMPQ